jgi:hypothetical protein
MTENKDTDFLNKFFVFKIWQIIIYSTTPLLGAVKSVGSHKQLVTAIHCKCNGLILSK